MRVCSLLDGPPIGGVLSYSMLLAELLETDGSLEFSIVTPDEPGLSTVSVLELNGSCLVKLDWQTIRNADVVLVHNYRSHTLAAKAVLGRRSRPAIVSVLHGRPIRRPGARELLKRRLDDLLNLCITDLIVQVAPGSRQNRLGCREPAYTVRNAGPRYRGRAPYVSGVLRVGYVGRFSREKGVERLPDLFRQLLQVAGDRQLECRLFGDGSLRDLVLTNLPQQLSVECSVGVVDWNSIDVVVVPSFQEGSPMVIPEALAAGCGVVASSAADDGGWPDLPQMRFLDWETHGAAASVLAVDAAAREAVLDDTRVVEALDQRRAAMSAGYRDVIAAAARRRI